MTSHRMLALAAAGALLAALGLAPAARARRPAAGPKMTLTKTISLDHRTKPPTFSPVNAVSLMDQGRLLYLGTGLFGEQEAQHLLQMSDLSRLAVQVPLARFIRDNPGMKRRAEDRRPVHEQFVVGRLLFYDRATGEAGVEVADRLGTGAVRRHFFLHWDLKRDRITGATLVARARSGASHADSLALGYDPARKAYYYLRQIYPKGRRSRVLTAVAFRQGKPRVVAQFSAGRSLQRQTYFDRRHHRALVLEYAELADKTPPPRGHLVDLASGKVHSFPIPLTAYGAAFAPDGQTLFVYSSQLGELWEIAVPEGTRRRQVRVGKRGHALGFVAPQTLLLVRNRGLRYLKVSPRLRPGPFVPARRFIKGFSHLEGSQVIPGGALLRNGDRLLVLKVR